MRFLVFWAASVLSAFLAANDTPQERLTSYRALRTLEASARGGRMHATLTAWTSFDAAHGFEYSIVEERGSNMIRGKVLRAVLESERSLARHGARDGALSDRNYEFAIAGETDDGLVRVELRPRRVDTLLLRGHLFLSSAADLVRVEGSPVKRPSFWTRRVDVVRRYERIAGVRVPVAMESVADVRLEGRSTFSMTYRYESVNGVVVQSRGSASADR